MAIDIQPVHAAGPTMTTPTGGLVAPSAPAPTCGPTNPGPSGCTIGEPSGKKAGRAGMGRAPAFKWRP